MGYLSELITSRSSQQRRMFLSWSKMKLLLKFPEWFRKVIFYGRARYCPVCRSNVRAFFRFGPLINSCCPVCASLRRHRIAWLFFQQRTNLFDLSPKRMLHVAPELCFKPKFKQIPFLDYVSADLHDGDVTIKMDITNIPHIDNAFDIIFCSHVLEHVPDDRRAVREIMRVLRPGGWAVIMVPVRMNRLTDEDLTVTDPREREKRFGQHNHVRYYGRDITDRLKEAGFNVTVSKAPEIVNPNQFDRIGVIKGVIVFFCEKDLGSQSMQPFAVGDRQDL